MYTHIYIQETTVWKNNDQFLPTDSSKHYQKTDFIVIIIK